MKKTAMFRQLVVVVTASILMFALPATAGKRVNFGGTNHWLYAYGTADGLNTNYSWYLPVLNLRPTVAHYHLAPSTVASQIQALRGSGAVFRARAESTPY